MISKTSIWLYACAVATIVADQLSKFIVRSVLHQGHAVTLIPGLLDLELSYNSGAAFGVLPNWAPLFIIITLIAVFAIVRIGRGTVSRNFAAGLGLLLGGAIGNLIDRLFMPERRVTDFLSLHISLGGTLHAWPTFNIADIGIVVGAVLVFFNVYVLEKRGSDAESPRDTRDSGS